MNYFFVLDPINKDYILKSNGVKRISDLLNHSNTDVVISSITTLMYLVTPESKPGKDLDNIEKIFIYELAPVMKSKRFEETKLNEMNKV